MLSITPKKGACILALIIVLSVALAASSAHAATKRIKAKSGGVIKVDKGIKFRIPPRSLEKDTTITIDVIQEQDYVAFEFGPSGTIFAEDKPAQLMVTWRALALLGISDPTLYGEDDEPVHPNMKWYGLKYGIKGFYLEHFSLYYYRRR